MVGSFQRRAAKPHGSRDKEYFPRKRVDILRTLRRVRPVIKGITRGVKSGKTNRSAAKRYTVTAKGRVIHAAQNRRHNMYHKGRKLVNSMGPDRELRGGQKQMALKLLNLK